ncbi:MAG: hypothetical protein KDB79_12345, partial [Acidobacteria bacterium]|nr:hypothetical protein [Acidobacteriota bacterium]
MKTSYIQFDSPKSATQDSKDRESSGAVNKALVRILASFIPKANPDFDDQIENVRNWLVECETETGIPIREIGLDNEGRVLLKM